MALAHGVFYKNIKTSEIDKGNQERLPELRCTNPEEGQAWIL